MATPEQERKFEVDGQRAIALCVQVFDNNSLEIDPELDPVGVTFASRMTIACELLQKVVEDATGDEAAPAAMGLSVIYGLSERMQG